MIRKRKISKPYDFSLATMYNEYPKILHENIGAPGIYIRKANNKVVLKDGTTGEMDSSYIIGPDGKTIFELMAVNGQHQSTPLTLDKLKMIGNYSIQQIHDENMPQLSYVVTHIPKDRHVQFYEQTPSQIIKPLLIILDEAKIKEKLINVRNIINNQEEIRDEDALELGIIVLFAQRDKAREITKEVISLYAKISRKLSKKMELTLYAVIYAMIDAHLDDEKEYKKVINMIKENTSQESIEKFETIDIMLDKINDSENELNNTKNKLTQSENELNNTKNKLTQSKKRISELEKTNQVANTKIKELENTIKQLKKAK